MASQEQLLDIENELTDIFSVNSFQKITYDSVLSAKVLKHYHILFGARICGTCPNLIYPALVKLKKEYKTQIITIMESQKRKYNFKQGASYRPFGRATAVTNANLTDEYAEDLLKKYPNLISLFDVAIEEVAPNETENQNKEIAEVENAPAIESEVAPKAKSKKK